MSKDISLRALAEDYRLELNGVRFWAPYWRDELPTVGQPYPVTGPYKGKGTPPQLLRNLQGYLETSTEREPEDAEGYRQLMHQLHLGIDCSGFAFYILELWLAQRKIKLADHLYKPRKALLDDFNNPVYTHPASITQELLESQPEQVALSTIQRFWGNDPVRLAGVAILTSAAATRAVRTAAEVRPGDIIGMTGSDGILHCVVILECSGSELAYAHSARISPNEPGGITFGKIIVTAPSRGITEQEWDDPLHQRLRFADEPIRRLKVLGL